MQPQKPDEQNSKPKPSEAPAKSSSEKAYWLAFVMALVAIIGIAFGVQGNHDASEALARQKAMKGSLDAMQQTVDSLTARLHDQEQAAQPHPPATAEPAPDKNATPDHATQTPAPPAKPARKSPVEHRRPPKSEAITAEAKPPADDPRFKEIDDRLTIQEQHLADTQKAVQDARHDMDDKLSSTKDELNGSIARTHAEVVALQQKGERNYYEFKLDKSKNMTRVGPIQVALRKADLKRKRFDLEMLVDDNKLQKKSVNLFEPVYILTADASQPMQLVVNRVEKDSIGGYVAVPKYTQSRLRLGEMEEKLPQER